MSNQDEVITRLETDLEMLRRYALRATKDLHSVMGTDLEAAATQIRNAERRAAEAEHRAQSADLLATQAMTRADAAEWQLSDLRASATWKAGRVVVTVPALVRRLVKRMFRMTPPGNLS